MKRLVVFALAAWPLAASARLQVVPDATPQAVFSGAARAIRVMFHNPTEQPVEANLSVRLIQTSSATALPVSVRPWKKLQVLAGQTVLETASIDFPAVRAGVRFIVQWIAEGNTVVGTTDVMVYPLHLLRELRPLLDGTPLGVLDPQNLLKPLLQQAQVEFEDLEDRGLGTFTGRLAVLGPFASREQMPHGLAAAVRERAKAGVAVVWIQPPPSRRLMGGEPSTYRLALGRGVVVADAATVAGLAENPWAQLNLVHLARVALNPEYLQLPDPKP